MSYQVLARKYRPRRFAELIGQEHVARALINALDQDRLHHAYLFTGTRGVGKTTIARILAKCLNCETGISSEPCGVCSTCREVDEGRFVDLIEVDAASRTKVEDTRELLDNVQYAPTRGRYKVYLIDEVHMLSGHSFNALLKTLEEPPPHVKFLLATTDPQKLPITILSRCLQFALKAMSPERVVEHLTAVLQKEMVAFEDGALWELGRAANGSMRDALSLTDQAIAFGNGRLQRDDVRSMLGSIDRDLVFRVLEAVHSADAAAVLSVSAQLAEQSVDFSGALAELVSTLHRVALAQMLPDAIDNALGDRERVLVMASALTPEDTQLYYQIAVQGRRDMPFAADLRSGFEMTLLRMLAFRPVPSAPQSGAGQGAGVGNRNAPTHRTRPVANTSGTTQANRMGSPSQVAAAEPRSGTNVMGAVALKADSLASEHMNAVVAAPAMAAVAQAASNVVPIVPASRSSMTSAAPLAAEQVPAALGTSNTISPKPAGSSVQITTLDELCQSSAWEAWLRSCGLAGGALNLARHAALVQRDGQRVELQLAPKHEMVASAQSVAQLEAMLQQHFSGLSMTVAHVEPSYAIPMQVLAERKRARLASAERALRDDPIVKELMTVFDAELSSDTITPID